MKRGSSVRWLWVVAFGVLGLGGAVAWRSLTSVPPRPTPWPNEPPGFRVLSEQPWDAVPSLEWEAIWGPSQVTLDPLAPESPPHVLEIIYPAGFIGGSAPGTVVRRLPSLSALYVGFWWRANTEWQGHETGVNKLQFVFPKEAGDITMVMYGPPAGPFELRVLPQFVDLPSEWLRPNRDSIAVSLGEWHRVEWLLVASSAPGARDGISRWWLDGTMVGSYTDLRFPARPF